jgi:hypothetical protein
MTDTCNTSFDWNELIDLFRIREAQTLNDEDRMRILEKINALTDRFGREYVIRKIALQGR